MFHRFILHFRPALLKCQRLQVILGPVSLQKWLEFKPQAAARIRSPCQKIAERISPRRNGGISELWEVPWMSKVTSSVLSESGSAFSSRAPVGESVSEGQTGSWRQTYKNCPLCSPVSLQFSSEKIFWICSQVLPREINVFFLIIKKHLKWDFFQTKYVFSSCSSPLTWVLHWPSPALCHNYKKVLQPTSLHQISIKVQGKLKRIHSFLHSPKLACLCILEANMSL